MHSRSFTCFFRGILVLFADFRRETFYRFPFRKIFTLLSQLVGHLAVKRNLKVSFKLCEVEMLAQVSVVQNVSQKIFKHFRAVPQLRARVGKDTRIASVSSLSNDENSTGLAR